MIDSKQLAKESGSEEELSSHIKKQVFGHGDAYAHIYMCEPFGGIYLWANDIHISKIPTEKASHTSFIKLNICLEGHCEVMLANGRYVYAEPGILSLDANTVSGFYQYQTKHYCGIELAADFTRIEAATTALFSLFGLSCEGMERLMQNHNGSYLSRVNSECLTLAADLFKNLREASLNLSDYRFALLELLYTLSKAKMTALEKDIYLTKGQREIAQQAESILRKDFSIRHTVEDLATAFDVSPSSLKKYFTLRYGEPVSTHMRKLRMEYAAHLLSETDASIGDIAEKSGYDSQSKFSSAFKKHMGATPMEYRRLQTVTNGGKA